MAMQYDNFINDLSTLIDLRAKTLINVKQKPIVCKVENTDGFVVEVVQVDYKGDVIEGRKPISNITILQSKYFSPCVQKDDYGVLLNISIFLGNIIYGSVAYQNIDRDYYVFVPFVKKADFKSKPDEFMIQSLDEKSKFVVDNLNITETTTNKTITCEKNISASAKENFTMASEKTMAINAKNSLKIASDSEVSIESKGSMSINSTSPLEIKGGGQSLATALDTFCTSLGALASAGFEAAAIASIVAAANALKAQLKGILK